MSKPDLTTVTQSSTLDIGFAGQVITGEPHDIVTHTNSGATALDFGIVCVRDTSNNGSAKAMAADADRILGVTVRNPLFPATADGNNTVKYNQYSSVPVMIRGTICVQAAEDVRRDDQVLVLTAGGAGNTNAGSLGGSKGGVAGSGRVNYPNAIWLDDTSSGKVGRIRVDYLGDRRLTT